MTRDLPSSPLVTTTPDSPAEGTGRAREGVWLSPQGFRAEVVRENGRWRSYVYMSRTGGTPTVIDHPDEADLAEGIARLEAQGWTYAPERKPDGPRTVGEASARQWSPANVIGAIALVLAVLLVISLLS